MKAEGHTEMVQARSLAGRALKYEMDASFLVKQATTCKLGEKREPVLLTASYREYRSSSTAVAVLVSLSARLNLATALYFVHRIYHTPGTEDISYIEDFEYFVYSTRI